MIGGRELSRTTDFVTAGDLLASSLNEQLDSNVIMSQQLDERFGRTIKAQPGDEDATLDLPLVADRVDKIMLFDTEGNLTASSASDFFTNSVLGGNYIINTATGNGSQTAFGLTSSPSVKTNIQVYIDGVYQNKATFSLSGSTLTFSEAPPLNAAIEFMMGEAVTQITGDASAITYNQGGTGAQDRTVKAKLQETVSVKDFGAVGDGVTDDTAAIQAALDSGSKNVLFPTGTYVISSGLNITSSMNVSCDEEVVINGTAIPASVTLSEQHILKATGSLGSSIALTSNITEEDITITLASTAGLAAGDYILVSSTGKFAAGWTGSNYQGWITTVESVDSGTQITVSTKAFSDLLVSDTAIVQKINHISVNWSGGKLLGRGLNGGHVGFPLAYCVDSSVEGLEIDGCEGSGVSFSTCFNCHATRLSVKNCLSTPALGNTGYGFVAVSGTQYSSCSHSYFERCRHSVSGGGTYPARFIDILHNHSVDGGRGTRDFDCHEPCFFWKFDGNSTVGDNGGFIIRGQYVNITNNYIRNSGQIAIDIRGYGTLTDGITDFVVDGNVIDQARTGVQVSLNDSITPKNAVISNNTIRNTELEGVIVGSAENVTIIGNTIDTTTDGSGADGNGIRAGSVNRLIISNNMIGNTIDGGILTENNTDMLVANNVYYNITGVNWVDTGSTFVNTDNTSTGVLSQGNFTGATNFDNKSLVVAAKNATAGSGTYGGSLAFARVNTNEPRAAIVSHQLTTNNEQVGMSFWSHPTNTGSDPMEHMLTLSHVGNFYPEDDQARALGLAAKNWSKAYMGQLNIVDGITAPSTEAGHACIYVDTADGDLKVKFGNGTVKTIVTDT